MCQGLIPGRQAVIIFFSHSCKWVILRQVILAPGELRLLLKNQSIPSSIHLLILWVSNLVLSRCATFVICGNLGLSRLFSADMLR